MASGLCPNPNEAREREKLKGSMNMLGRVPSLNGKCEMPPTQEGSKIWKCLVSIHCFHKIWPENITDKTCAAEFGAV